MDISELTLKDLQYIVALERHTSFSQAAAACNVSQPGLSRQIKNIEAMLGVQLFERTKPKVMPTEIGLVFIMQAHTILRESEKLLEIAAWGREVLSDVFNLGVIASSFPYLMPRLIGPLRLRYPNLKLIAHEGFTEHLITKLEEGELDAIIAATPIQNELLAEIPLFFEPFVLATSKEYKIQASKMDLVDIRDVNLADVLLLDDGNCLKDQTLDLCAFYHKVRSLPDTACPLRASSVESLLYMIASGVGIAVVPEMAAEKDRRLHSDLNFYEFKREKTERSPIGRTMALYYRKSYPFKENIRALVRVIKDNIH